MDRSLNSNAEKLVSVALCTYNGAKYLHKQLDSLLAQSYGNFEIVAMDDCSSDDTMSILLSYAQRDARLRVTRHESNVGFALNFQMAMQQCRGEFIAPCDQDDVWLPEKLAVLLAAIGEKSLAYCDSQYIDAHDNFMGIKLSDKMMMTSTADPLRFAFENFVSGHTMLFRRELLDALPVPSSFGFYDWWLAAAAAASGGIVFCGECLVLYRQHGANVTDSLRQRVVPRRSRPQGYRFLELREVGSRLESLLRLNKERRLISRLSLLWRARERQWVSPELALLMVTHRRRIFANGNVKGWRRVRRCVKFFWGIKAKRLVSPHAYKLT